MNSNCLQGMQCKCSSEGPFRISVRTAVLMSDKGSQEVVGDIEFDNDALCVCCQCGLVGVVGDFKGSLQRLRVV